MAEANAVAQPEIAGTAEIITGNDQKIFFLCLFGERLGVAAGSFYKKIECAVRLCYPIACGNQTFV